jgi:FkbM family methyltransferase
MIIKTKWKILIAKVISKIILSIAHGKDPVIYVKRNNIHYRLDLNEGIDLAIYLGVYEKSTVRTYTTLIKSGDCVLDVGANIGAHTLQFAQLVGDSGKVIAFEPTDYAFAKLQMNIGLNPRLSPRIIAHQMMLIASGEKPEDSHPEIYSSWPLTANKDVHPSHQGKKMSTSMAKAISLDEYVKSNNMEKVDVIKIDVDGFEYNVLHGSTSLIQRFKPIIIMELCPYLLKETEHTMKDILDIFESVHYRIKEMNTGKILPMDPDKLHSLIPHGSSINVIVEKK